MINDYLVIINDKSEYLIYAFEQIEMSSYRISNLDQIFIDYKLQTYADFYKICGKYIETWLSDLMCVFSFDKTELGGLKILMNFCVRKKPTAWMKVLIFSRYYTPILVQSKYCFEYGSCI